jgi:hypothetical protein
MVACFVAEELATGELVGCANLALMQVSWWPGGW